jgi:hypothetical protein
MGTSWVYPTKHYWSEKCFLQQVKWERKRRLHGQNLVHVFHSFMDYKQEGVKTPELLQYIYPS